MSLVSVADTFADSALPTNNYGAAGALGVTAALSKGTFSSVIQFDVSSAVTSFNTQYGVGNWSISGVQLSLASTPPNNAIFNGYTGTVNTNTAGFFDISWIGSDAWTEGNGTPSSASSTGGVTWNTLSSFTGGSESEGTFSYNPSATGLVGYTLTPTTGLVADINTGGLVSFYLSAADSSVSALFMSRTNSSKPTLSITATPEPGRIALLGLGLLGIVVRRRR